VRGARPEGDADPAEHRRVIDAFLAASLDGDFDALVAVLDPDIVLRADTGVQLGAPSREVRGAESVARAALTFSQLDVVARPALVNGGAGTVNTRDGEPFSIAGFTVHDGRITAINILADPDRLGRLDLAGPN
jgi:RNA polymerase sigma-70 factor (ECF subfamily)